MFPHVSHAIINKYSIVLYTDDIQRFALTFNHIGQFSTGVKHGLQLVLNVEHYQYTKGPHNAVGLKLLLHRKHDVPLVEDFGDNIPVGMHTFVAVDLSKVSVLLGILTPSYNTRLVSVKLGAIGEMIGLHILILILCWEGRLIRPP